MGGIEFYSVVSFSLVLGAILGALLSICLQDVWNSLAPGAMAFQASPGPQAKFASCQQVLRSDTFHRPLLARKEASIGRAGSQLSVQAELGFPFLDALWAFVADEPVASAKHPQPCCVAPTREADSAGNVHC